MPELMNNKTECANCSYYESMPQLTHGGNCDRTAHVVPMDYYCTHWRRLELPSEAPDETEWCEHLLTDDILLGEDEPDFANGYRLFVPRKHMRGFRGQGEWHPDSWEGEIKVLGIRTCCDREGHQDFCWNATIELEVASMNYFNAPFHALEGGFTFVRPVYIPPYQNWNIVLKTDSREQLTARVVLHVQLGRRVA